MTIEKFALYKRLEKIVKRFNEKFSTENAQQYTISDTNPTAQESTDTECYWGFIGW